MKSEKVISVVTTIVFLTLIFSLTIAGFFVPQKTFSENENRYLALQPEFSFKSLYHGDFTSEYETYITDQFIGRDTWISIKTLTEKAMLKKDINGVYFAKDGYLIEKHRDTDIDYKQLDKNLDRVVMFTKNMSEVLGKEHVQIMIVPTAAYVLKDKLPKFAPEFNQEEMINNISESITKAGGTFIDVKDILKEHKDEYIFYKTDHHWTTLGAYYAYCEWAKNNGYPVHEEKEFDIEKASNEFYGTIYSKVNSKVTPDEMHIYNWKDNNKFELVYNMGEKKTDTLYDRSKLEEKDKYSVYLGGNNALLTIKSKNKNGKKLLVVKDSYAHSFVPFVVNDFEETHMVDFRYFNMGINQYIEENGITDVLVLYNTINFTSDKNTGNFVK